jgi:hypothetical protein
MCNQEGIKGPPSYLVRDIGKTGVPPVDAADMAMLHKIMRYVHPSTLRFTYIPGILHFVVYDAQNGPCSSAPYDILNAPACNTVFLPSDVRHGAFAASGGCFNRPRPWIPHDGGNPNAPPWEQFDNSH